MYHYISLDKAQGLIYGYSISVCCVDAIYTGYGEGGNGKGTDGKGPNQNMLNNRGETYLQELFPKLTIIRSVTILKDYQPRP